MNQELAELLAAEGVIALREHRPLRAAIKTALRRGEIVGVVRGVYAVPEVAETFRARCHALLLADPDAVLHGATAAALLKWGPEPRTLEVVSHRLHPRSWLRVSRRRLDPEQISHVDGLRLTEAPTTALDNATRTEGGTIDHALRTGVALERLRTEITRRRHRRGVRHERLLLAESRDQPWSPAERRAHTLLRSARITGWLANLRVICPGRVAYIDLAFKHLNLAVEIDGDEWHLEALQVIGDRERDQDLTAQGWTVVHFRAIEVFRDPEKFLRMLRAIIASRTPGARRRRPPTRQAA